MRRLCSLFSVVLIGALAAASTTNKPKSLESALGASSLLAGTPGDFTAACKADLASARDAISKLTATKPPRDTVAAMNLYDEASRSISDALTLSGLAQQTSPQKEMRDAAEQCERDGSALATDISLNRGVYDALLSLDTAKVDADTRYYVERTLGDFRRAGVDRDEVTRARVKALRDELVGIGQEFGRNIAQDVRTLELDPADLNGLPDDFKKSHPAGADGKVTLKTDNTDYVPFMTYATSEKAREQFWKLYRLRGHPKNLDVLARMMAKRWELSTMLGYRNWAAYVTEDKMIGSEKNAAEFIDKIAAASDARAQHDYQQLLARKQKDDPSATAVMPWDSTRLGEQIKAEQYAYDSQAVRPYLEYTKVKQGLLDITSRMFGISYRRVPTAKVWHPDVEAYDVLEKGKTLGRIYFDMFPRENKYKHYATFPMIQGKKGVSLPEGALVCNFPKPNGSEPALMQHGDVEVFFHEYGHLLALIFSGQPRWTGPGVQWDFVEAPSQMLEEWVWDPATLQTFAKHYKTGEPIPTELVKKMKAADDFGRGLGVRQQMFYAALSLNYYNRDPRGVDSTALMGELQSRYTPFKYVPGTYMQEAFDHLNGYSAIYYTYMWSLVIAKDMFTPFRSGGLLNPEVAGRYRHAVLEPMNSRPSAQVVQDFLQRPYGFKAYEDWLNGTGQ